MVYLLEIRGLNRLIDILLVTNMATNKNARLRYEALDKCLRNFSKKFYIEDLQEACNKFLSRELGEDKTVSKRQIYDDIKTMKNSPSMAAPIVAYQDGPRKYYRYSESGYSIVDLTDGELLSIEATIKMLSSFNGMPNFEWMQDILVKLKKKYKIEESAKEIISFESNIDLRGLERFRDLFNYILNKQTIRILYETFGKKEINTIIHPYFLKQYNNRWFLLGYNPEVRKIANYAIDRIKDVKIEKTEFIEDKWIIDPLDYFYDVIGLTIPKDQTIETIVLKFSKNRYPYVLSKPIHPSQKQNDKERTITIKVIPNKELESIILGFGKDVQVIEPENLRQELNKIYKECLMNYEVLKDDCKTTS